MSEHEKTHSPFGNRDLKHMRKQTRSVLTKLLDKAVDEKFEKDRKKLLKSKK